MADIGVKQQFLVTPDHEIEQMWIDVQIQEKKSRIVKTRQDIEDLIKGMKVKLEAQVMMLEREVKFLENKKTAIIDVEPNGS